jgi:cytochrome bd ubiquinol oxidase subunit II
VSTAVAVILWIGATAYAVFGGADFGGGMWDLLAGGAERGERPRDLIDRALTPVWEANHVWLIFCLVVLWTGFPRAFASIASTLCIPLGLAALGIVLRGSGFAFRKVVEGLSGRRAFGATFAISSLMTPFFMGAAVGAIAAGRVPASGTGDRLSSWTGPLSILVGALFVVACAYLAAVFLTVDARVHGHPELERYFRLRALGAGALAGALALAALPALHSDAHPIYDRLVHQAVPLVIASALAGIVVLVLLMLRRPGARPFAVLAVACVLWGWAVAQYPFLLPRSLTIHAGAAPSGSLTALFVVFGAAALWVAPALALLYRLQRGLEEES